MCVPPAVTELWQVVNASPPLCFSNAFSILLDQSKTFRTFDYDLPTGRQREELASLTSNLGMYSA